MHSKRIQKKVKEDYNSIADAFSQTRQFPWEDFARFLPYYKPSFKVLDLGCGNGRLLTFLDQHGYTSYLGVDQSEALLEHAKKLHPKNQFKVCDITDLEGIDEKYDVIFAIASFHHIPPEWQLHCLKSWHSKLKPGGYLFMLNWNLFQPNFWRHWPRALFIRPFGWRGLLIPWGKTIKRYYYAFTKRSLRSLLKKSGFELLEQDWIRGSKKSTLLNAHNLLTIAQRES